MPHSITPESASDRSVGTQMSAKCFCESACFAELPVHIQTQINEHYASPPQEVDECLYERTYDTFTCFPRLPSAIQERIAELCLPAGEVRYLAPAEHVGDEAASSLLQTLPAAAKANKLFYKLFKDGWKLSVTQDSDNSSDTSVIQSHVNFALDTVVIDIKRPLLSMSRASHIVQHQSSLHPGALPLEINETWAHNMAQESIPNLPPALFEAMPTLSTYWLVLDNIPHAHFTNSEKEQVIRHCKCVYAPMLQCLGKPAKDHPAAYRYHLETGKVEYAEPDFGDEFDTLLSVCGEGNPNFAARVTFVHDNKGTRNDEGLRWWPMYPPGLLNQKYTKLRKRLDWGVIAGVLTNQVAGPSE